jgi:biotin carboxylase
MRGIGYNNGFFNMEFKYDPAIDWIGIIEVNPRLCGQFADLYEKVDGFNTFELLLALLNGDRPEVTKKLGQFTNAASCVLRRFSDAQVIQIPSQKQLNEIANRFAGMRIEVMAQEGERLSDLKQDTASYRYCIFNIGGASHADLMQKKEAIETELQFTFQE